MFYEKDLSRAIIRILKEVIWKILKNSVRRRKFEFSIKWTPFVQIVILVVLKNLSYLMMHFRIF